MKAILRDGAVITLGSLLYALATHFFVFPSGLFFGGTSGISVILEFFLPFSASNIITVINFALLLAAFLILGKSMAVKTTVGSALTTLFIALTDVIFPQGALIDNLYISSIVGALIIAAASGFLFYVDSSSGGTDILALIVRKYIHTDIGVSLLITDFAIVLVGGILCGVNIAVASLLGLLIKITCIDAVMKLIKKVAKKA